MDVLDRRHGEEKRENGLAANRRLTCYTILASLFYIAPFIDIPMFTIIANACLVQ